VCLEYRNPVSIVTKSALVERDLDLLVALAREGAASVTFSRPFLDRERARALEPGAAALGRRLRALERLAAAGVPSGVLVAPVIPGLNDEEIPRVLAAARGATRAGWLLLQLPGSAARVFEERLRAALPERAEPVLHRIRETLGSALDDGRLVLRMRGDGPYARFIGDLFAMAARRLGLETGQEERGGSPFRRPGGRQQELW